MRSKRLKLTSIARYVDAVMRHRDPKKRQQALARVPVHLRPKVEKWLEVMRPKDQTIYGWKANEKSLGNMNGSKN